MSFRPLVCSWVLQVRILVYGEDVHCAVLDQRDVARRGHVPSSHRQGGNSRVSRGFFGAPGRVCDGTDTILRLMLPASPASPRLLTAYWSNTPNCGRGSAASVFSVERSVDFGCSNVLWVGFASSTYTLTGDAVGFGRIEVVRLRSVNTVLKLGASRCTFHRPLLPH